MESFLAIGTHGGYLAGMILPGTIVLRPNGFSQPDFDVIYKDPDGRELSVGRIYRDITGNRWRSSAVVLDGGAPSATRASRAALRAMQQPRRG